MVKRDSIKGEVKKNRGSEWETMGGLATVQLTTWYDIIKALNKPIKFTHHSLDSMKKRGSNEAEVIQAIDGSSWRPAKADRYESDANFTYNSYWNGKYYKMKQVMPVFKEEDDSIVIITVYVFYF